MSIYDKGSALWTEVQMFKLGIKPAIFLYKQLRFCVDELVALGYQYRVWGDDAGYLFLQPHLDASFNMSQVLTTVQNKSRVGHTALGLLLGFPPSAVSAFQEMIIQQKTVSELGYVKVNWNGFQFVTKPELKEENITWLREEYLHKIPHSLRTHL